MELSDTSITIAGVIIGTLAGILLVYCMGFLIDLCMKIRKWRNCHIKKCSISLFVKYIGNNTYTMHINLSKFVSFESDIVLWAKYDPDKDEGIKFIKAKAQRIKNEDKIHGIVKIIKSIYYNHEDAMNEHFKTIYKNKHTAIILTYSQNGIFEETYFQTELDPLGPIVAVRTEGKEYEL